MPDGIVNTAFARSGVAEVDLVGEVYDLVPPDEQLPAVAQIVLTLTQRPGIGQVSFTLDGEPLRVRLGNGQTTDEAGQPVSADDYAVMLDDERLALPPPIAVTAPSTTLRPPTPGPTSRRSGADPLRNPPPIFPRSADGTDLPQIVGVGRDRRVRGAS